MKLPCEGKPVGENFVAFTGHGRPRCGDCLRWVANRHRLPAGGVRSRYGTVIEPTCKGRSS